MMQTTKSEFLKALFGSHPTEKAAIQLYAYRQGSNWAQTTVPQRFTDVDAAAAFAERNDKFNIFFNVALMAKAKSGRGSSEDARLLPGLFADLDADEGEHKGKRATKAELLEMLEEDLDVPKPSILIDSGGGYHAYWLFDKPVTDMAEARALLVGINEQLYRWHKQRGYKYERLKDLSRVLRVLATNNHKTKPPKQVELVWPADCSSARRYKPAELQFKVEEQPETTADVTDDFDIDEDIAYRGAIDKCLKIEPEWGSDASSFVVKCCRQCVRAGCSEGQAVRVVKAIRAIRQFPGDWTDTKIAMRYASALEQSDLGSAAIEEYEKSDYGFTRRVCDLLGGRAMYIYEWGKWVTWTGKNFRVGRPREIQTATIQVTKDLLLETPKDDGSKEAADAIKKWVSFCMQYQSRGGLDNVRSIAMDIMATGFESLDKKTDLFHADNFTLRLDDETGRVQKLPHSPENLNTQLSQVPYIEGAKCPRWEKFISEIAVEEDGRPSTGLADYLQRIAGFCLTGRVDNQALYILHGGGSNGKGAFCRILLKVLGGFGTSVSQDLLIDKRNSGHPTQFATLYGKRCVIAQETDAGCKLNESQVKWLTGSDGIICRRMREDEWTFEPTHKLFLATNNLPIIRGTDTGIWRRVKLIPFRATVVPDPKLEPDLLKELPGILNWCIEGYRKVVCEGGLAEPDDVKTAQAEYRNDMDIVAQFVEDKCILSPGLTATNEALFAAFELYCKAHGQHVPSARKLSIDLERIKGVAKGRTKTTRFKSGIGLRSEAPDSANDIDVFEPVSG